jgi:succinate dehydrogenase/fumarate reductase flavoprotein subunit
MKKLDIEGLRMGAEVAQPVQAQSLERREIARATPVEELARMMPEEVLARIDQAERDVTYLETQLRILDKFPAYFNTHILGEATHAQKEELMRMMNRYAGHHATLKKKLQEAREGLLRLQGLKERLREAMVTT